jgi:hypothetical protein
MGTDDEVERRWVPTRGYDFELTIEGNDFSNDVMEVNILSSIEVPYMTVLINMNLDPTSLVLNKIYGQIPIQLSIKHFGQIHPGIPDEQIDLELMYVSADFDILMKNPLTSQYRMKDRTPIQLTTVCRDPFTIMNTYVNGVYIGKNVGDIINDLSQRVNATVVADTNGINTEVIDQVMIPPMTFYQALRYLNKTFGLYNGISSFYCLQDKPKSRIYIKNLTSKIESSINRAAIYQLAAGGSNDEALTPADVADMGGQTYYTHKSVETQYKGNTAFSILGPRMVHIVKPGKKLYTKIDINTDDFVKKYGLIYGGKTIYYDSQTINPESRVSFFKDHTGYEDTQTHINANWSKLLSDLSTLVVTLERNVFLTPLLHVGDGVVFTSFISEMKDFCGRYILSSTELAFARANRECIANAKLTLIRSNRTLE